ncbi:MAG: insulinase family protein [Methylococcaceae bacterium]|nr:insulinase family protein [Methylococcaceae bacterium]
MTISIRQILFFLCLSAVVVPAQPEVSERRLENGLKILVKEDHRAPVVVSQVWYKVGSSYEYGGITGISHILEHMMFKGTKKHPPGDFSRIIAENGGQENAFTGRDYTAYFESLEKTRLPVSFELEADRMRNLQLTGQEFDKEREVVLEERRMRTDDQPRSKVYEYFSTVAHTNGGYQNPIIGWADDIRNLSVQDLQDWYELWYAPNNATLVVVGDVDPNAVFALAKQHFGPLKSGKPVKLKPRVEVEQVGVRRLNVRLPAELPYLLMGYKIPVLKTIDSEKNAYALEVLAGILDGGDSARLASRLVRGKQLAVSASAGYDLYARLTALFLFDATPAQGHSLEQLEKALKAEIKELQTRQVAPDELDRVKAQVLADNIYDRDSVFNQAMQLGELETVGLGWQRMDQYVERINQVTAKDILASAKKYLHDDKLTVAYLEPLPIDRNKPAPRSPGDHHAH